MQQIKKDYIYSNQLSLHGEAECIGFGSESFYVKEIDRNLANNIIIKNHYSKKVISVPHQKIDLGVFVNDILLGVLQYGYSMNPASCNKVVIDTEMNQHLELNRMWLSDKIEISYPESQAISCSIKYIKRKFPKIKWIQSFADERCGGFGIVYQACSFSYYGEHSSVFWELDGVVYHNSRITNGKRKMKAKLESINFLDKATKHTLRQFRYIKFLDSKWKKKCLLKEQPYPKHYNND